MDGVRYYTKGEIEQGMFLTVYLAGANEESRNLHDFSRYAIIRADDLEYNGNDNCRFSGLMISNMNTGKWLYEQNGGIWFHKRWARPSTEEEIEWLLACGKAGHVVDRSEVKTKRHRLLELW
jgi:hypothetical protein